ncbi:F-box/WD repeat-containing protein 7 [Drosophila innubila]|uniref:F-box/WD repeat-containing protein 7 n=1 Tax=Drosophila innubila TaxID=198719 RepID=UPI00148C2F11|nr:F-box/WD repeat-containing protein 7 [Drosophila innubila]XP_034480724.1 F-box/WD repeat-containing protein 7 [Drosophila innubila]
MEKGCSAASSNCKSAEEAQQELSELKPEKEKEKEKKTTTPQGPQSKPSTSQVRLEAGAEEPEELEQKEAEESMSKLRAEDVADVDCVSHSSHSHEHEHGHGFAVVLDDESSTETGVLETFEISSSNSLPPSHSTGARSAASTVGVVVVVPVDDSSSTDTLSNGNENENGNSEDHSVSASSMNNVFFNDNDNEPPVVCLINDDDDFDEEEIVEDEEEDDEDQDQDDEEQQQQQQQQQQSMPIDCPNTSQLDGGIITTADGSKIFLETPVVEEPQSHPINHHPSNATAANVTQSELLTGKPKRLSDEFDAPDQEQDQETTRGVKSEMEAGQEDVASTSLHDRQMSVRLKQMSLTANSNSKEAMSSSHSLSKADIESMDRIERRDFETEQRLTGGIVLGTSKLINKNRLNLSLINAAGATVGGAAAGAGGASAGGVNSSSSSDDWPSSSNGRAFSSDSKCTYKDLSTTPTSSRKYTNSRLSKSTAKLNLGSTLGTANTAAGATGGVGGAGCPQHSSSSNALKSSVIVEPSGSSSSSNASTTTSTSTSSTSTSDVYTNTNSNDNLNAAAADKDSSSSDKDNSTLTVAPVAASTSTSTSFSSVGSQTTSQEGGCSRTSVVPCAAFHQDVDAQPSTSATSTTSSARCHYAAATSKVATRQVNASAQTQERFLARSGLTAGGGAGGAGAGNNNRSRRRVEATRNGSNDVIVLEVVVEENANGEGAHVEPGDFSADEPWGNCDGDEENNCSDLEEICTCQNSMMANSRSGSNGSLSEGLDMDATDGYHHQGTAGEESLGITSVYCSQQRKRKYNEGRLLDGDYSMSLAGSAGTAGGAGAGGAAGGETGDNSRKRIAYDFASTPRSSSASAASSVMLSMTPTGAGLGLGLGLGLGVGSSPALGRRTPRALMPTRDNPPPELQHWLAQFQRWSHAERLLAVDRLIDHCDPSQVRHMMKVIEPQFQRDFISLLPRELALFVLSYLEPKDLLRAAQTCRSWRFLCDDNLLWKEKCRKAQILTESRSDRPKRGRDGNMPPIASPWKAAYMRQHIIEMNWRSRPVRKPKVLKGHDDHVITCLQFSGNRIVSGSDDNTLKVWSAVNGKCLRTLVGHTGGVWSSQMSGNIIISGSTDRTLKVWDMDSGSCVHTLQGHTSTVRCMHLHGNKVVSGSRDATLRVWDITLGTCLHVLVGHLAAVRCVQYDGKLIVSGAYDYMVKIWHPERQECLHTLQGHTNRVYSLQFDGLHVVSGSLDTSIRVWDVETGNCKHTLMGHQSLTSGMELRQNILVSGNADSTVKVWDITTGQCLQTLSGPNKHQSAVTCLQFNSRFVVTSSDDGTVKLWDVKTGDFIRNLVALDSGGSGGVVWRIRANDTKLICAVGSRNGTEETKLMVLDFDVEGACVKCS